MMHTFMATDFHKDACIPVIMTVIMMHRSGDCDCSSGHSDCKNDAHIHGHCDCSRDAHIHGHCDCSNDAYSHGNCSCRNGHYDCNNDAYIHGDCVVEMRTSTVMNVIMTHTSMVTVIVVEMRTSTVMNVIMTHTSVVTVIVVEMRTSTVMNVIMMHTSMVTLMMMHTASHCLQHCKVCAKSQSADVVFYFICTHT